MRLLLGLFTLAVLAAAPDARVYISAHRGAMKLAPENTLHAFEVAAALGADYIETDIRQTADGALVLMHDDKTDRTTGFRGEISKLTFRQIRSLDAGNGQRVPTLREALAWARGRGVAIDIDYKAGRVEDVAAVVRELGMTRHVVVEGNRETLKRFVELLPGVDTMPKVTSIEEIPAVCAELKTTIIRLSLEQLAQPGAAAAVKACGARVSVTILGQTDNEEVIRRVIAQGAQVIETDHPELVARLRQ